jgi:hypothetical protein
MSGYCPGDDLLARLPAPLGPAVDALVPLAAAELATLDRVALGRVVERERRRVLEGLAACEWLVAPGGGREPKAPLVAPLAKLIAALRLLGRSAG